MKKTPLRKRSKKLASENAIYKADYTAVEAAVYLVRCCYCGCSGRSGFQRHHFTEKGRYGNGLYFWCYLHSVCHDWVHAHPNKARELGLLDLKWEERYRWTHEELEKRLKARGL